MSGEHGARRASGWQRLRDGLVGRPRRAQVGVALLCGLLAFGLVTQVQSTAGPNGLAAARVDDLAGILTDLNARADRLQRTVADLRASERRLRSGSGATEAALREARDRARTLGILTGALGARGPGIVLTVEDPRGRVRADVLVDALQELRDAGAEAIQLSGVRVVASTAIVDVPGGVSVDGTRLTPPYRFAAIGAARTLAAALAIPGGVVDTVERQAGAHARVVRSPQVTITALRQPVTPRYARPAR